MQSATTHLGDGEILHLVDRDASAWELDVWSKHVLDCEECGRRLAERRRAADSVRATLSVVRLPEGFPSALETMRAARARRPRPTLLGQAASRPTLRAAAAIAVLLLPVLLVSPVRAAVVDWLRQGWEQLAGALGTDEATPVASPEAPAADAPTYAVSFTPAGPELAVTLAARQAAGRISFTAATGTEATVEMRGGADESPLVTDAGLRILNGAASTAVYQIAVPASVSRVLLRVGAEPAVQLTSAQLNAGWSLDFGEAVR